LGIAISTMILSFKDVAEDITDETKNRVRTCLSLESH
jgi:hypothetical protein